MAPLKTLALDFISQLSCEALEPSCLPALAPDGQTFPEALVAAVRGICHGPERLMELQDGHTPVWGLPGMQEIKEDSDRSPPETWQPLLAVLQQDSQPCSWPCPGSQTQLPKSGLLTGSAGQGHREDPKPLGHLALCMLRLPACLVMALSTLQPSSWD